VSSYCGIKSAPSNYGGGLTRSREHVKSASNTSLASGILTHCFSGRWRERVVAFKRKYFPETMDARGPKGR